MTRREVHISSRELLDLLAGRIDPKRFAERHTAISSPVDKGNLALAPFGHLDKSMVQ